LTPIYKMGIIDEEDADWVLVKHKHNFAFRRLSWAQT